MTKKQFLILIGCMVVAIGFLFSLVAFSPFSEDIPRHSFKRNFDNRIYVSKQGEVDLKVNSFYIAGSTEHTLYLGNWTGPLHLTQVKLPNLDTLHMNITLRNTKIPDNYRIFRMSVDSPYFYLTHGVMPGVFEGRLDTLEAKNLFAKKTPYFIDAIAVSPKRFAVKSLSRESSENELAKLQIDSPYFEFKPDILQKQVDGMFCVDGSLHYDKFSKKLVYLYAYRNEYIVMDTGLNVLNRFHTIDTFKTARIKVAKVNSGNYSTLASPPARTNLKSCISGRLLFVESPFLAKNESKIEFKNSSSIDVYDINNGNYLYSFHLEAYNGQSASSFTVVGNQIAAVYDHHLVLYHLSLPAFKEDRSISFSNQSD